MMYLCIHRFSFGLETLNFRITLPGSRILVAPPALEQQTLECFKANQILYSEFNTFR
jgi:hypothetical protein